MAGRASVSWKPPLSWRRSTVSGGNSGAMHGQMYNMNTLIRHGSEDQRRRYLPKIATGELRLQAMGVTEPTTGTDTTKIKTTAVKKGDRYVINGQKVWISRVLHSDLMILLARDHAARSVEEKVRRHVDFPGGYQTGHGHGLTINPIRNMVNHETNELFFDNLEIPEENLIGEEGQGFKYILTGLNAERVLIAAECIGDGYWLSTRFRTMRASAWFSPADRSEPGCAIPHRRTYIETEAQI